MVNRCGYVEHIIDRPTDELVLRARDVWSDRNDVSTGSNYRLFNKSGDNATPVIYPGPPARWRSNKPRPLLFPTIGVED